MWYWTLSFRVKDQTKQENMRNAIATKQGFSLSLTGWLPRACSFLWNGLWFTPLALWILNKQSTVSPILFRRF
jgi:hypothetical protein